MAGHRVYGDVAIQDGIGHKLADYRLQLTDKKNRGREGQSVSSTKGGFLSPHVTLD